MFYDCEAKRRLLAALVALAVGCGRGAHGGLEPRVSAVQPPCASIRTAVAVTLIGNFPVRSAADLAGGVTIDRRYRAYLGEVELADVTWRDGQTLTATVPEGLEVGLYSVYVEGPGGRSASEGESFQAIDDGACLIGLAEPLAEPSPGGTVEDE